MTDKVQKIREIIEIVVNRRLNLLNGDYFDLNKETGGFTNEIMNIIDSIQEEPNISPVFDEGYWERLGEKSASEEIGDYDHKAVMEALHPELKEEPVSEELEEASYRFACKCHPLKTECSTSSPNPEVKDAFKAGAKWQKEHLWKSADGDDLPEIDREVIVLVKYSTQRNIHDEKYPTYRVEFGHRPNPKGWEGKSVTTGKVEHYTPKLYDKGGWNMPNVKYWLDCSMPKEIEL